MASDFVDALQEAWATDGTLAAAGIGTLHNGIDTDAGYPYAVISGIGGRKPLRTFGKVQIHERHYRVNIYSPSNVEAAALGRTTRTFLESVQGTPLVFEEGRQTDFHETGDPDLILTKNRRPGTEGQPFVWLSSSTWVLKMARDRA